METLKELGVALCVLATIAYIVEWIALPFKVSKTNDLLEDILKEIKRGR